MENKDRYVYYDRVDYLFREVEDKYLIDSQSFKDYFGYIDDQFDENKEIIVYKLVPHKVFKKEVTYKFKE